jgi:hypothetical protein
MLHALAKRGPCPHEKEVVLSGITKIKLIVAA